MLQKYLSLKNYSNRLSVLRHYKDFDKLITKQSLAKQYQSPLPVPSRHNKLVNPITRIETQFSGLILRRNYCSKPAKNVDRSWLSIRKQNQESNAEIKRLLTLIKEEKRSIFGSIGCLFVASIVVLGVPLAIGRIMDMSVMDNFPEEMLQTFCLSLLGIFVIGGLANFGRVYLIKSACKQNHEFIAQCFEIRNLFLIEGLRIIKNLRSRLYRTMINQDSSWHDTKGSGEIEFGS